MVVPVKALGQTPLLLNAVVAGAQIDPFVHHRPPPSFDEKVVVAASSPVQADLDLVILEDIGEFSAGQWAVLVGVKYLRGALACQRLVQCRCKKSLVSVFDRRQLSTLRVAQSRRAHRYRNPRGIGMYVRSVAQTGFDRSITTPRSRYG